MKSASAQGAMPPRAARVFLPVLLLALAGCTSETRQGGAVVFTFAIWVYGVAAWMTGGLLALGVFLILRPGVRRAFGVILLSLGIFFSMVVAPGVFMDTIVITPEKVSFRTGAWFGSMEEELSFANVRSIDLITQTESGIRNQKTRNHYLVFHLKNGSQQKIGHGTTMQTVPEAEILKAARSRQIPITDRR